MSSPDATLTPSEGERLLGEPAADPLPFVEIEAPYAPGLRPRPAGGVAASAEDELVARWNIGGSGDPAHPSRRAGFHPAVRVVIDTYPLRRLPARSPQKHVLTGARLLATARSRGYWPVRQCYEAALRRSPREAGETRLRVSIAPSGRVAAARLLATRIADPEGVSCLVSAMRGLRFNPAPPRRLDVDISVELWPGDAPPPALAEDPSTGAFDGPALHARLVEHRAEFARCYARALDRDRALWGRLALRVEVASEGRVHGAGEEESRFSDREVVACVAAAVQRLELPPSAEPYAFMLALRCGHPPEADAVPAAQTPGQQP